jgi:hypothetical protein
MFAELNYTLYKCIHPWYKLGAPFMILDALTLRTIIKDYNQDQGI